MKKCCKTCIYSRWDLTPTGRIARDISGRCVVQLPVVLLPSCVTDATGFSHEWHRIGIVPDDGQRCPLWEENHGKPIKKGITDAK
jgi:hypothetical protein